MPAIYLFEQGTVLGKASRRLIVEKDDKIIAEIPIFNVDRVFVFGNVQITTQALSFLLDEGIPTAFFYTNGKLKGILEPIRSKDIPLRLAQFEKASDPQFSLELAKTIVKGKLRNQRRLILRLEKNRKQDFSRERGKIGELIDSVDNVTTKKSLLGIEGSATRVYFSVYKRVLEGWGGFSGRKKRPPPDPVNALLSYGYTVLTTEMLFITMAAGFDPYLGFYHGVRYGRPALALDLVEEFRHPVIDMLVLEMISRRSIKAEDFYEMDEGFRMKKKVIRKFFRFYEKRMGRMFSPPDSEGKTTLRRVMVNQAYKLKACILEGETYTPFHPT